MNTSHGFCQQILYVFDVSRHDKSFRIGFRRVVTILSSAATPEFNCLLRVGVKSTQTLIHGDSFTGLARLRVRFALLFHNSILFSSVLLDASSQIDLWSRQRTISL